jgi:hypothetical protein
MVQDRTPRNTPIKPLTSGFEMNKTLIVRRQIIRNAKIKEQFFSYEKTKVEKRTIIRRNPTLQNRVTI